MKYSTEPKYGKYIKDYGFLSFTRKFGHKYGKKLMYTGIDAAKTASKSVVQKTAEPTGDLIGNKISDQITSVDKTKSNEKKYETNKSQEIYIPTKKDSKLLMT